MDEMERLSFFSYMADAVRSIVKFESRWVDIANVKDRYTRQVLSTEIIDFEEKKKNLMDEYNDFIKGGGGEDS